MMWQLVSSSWTLHASCNKWRVAPIAALLSCVLHTSVFGDTGMHVLADNTPGPLKWFCGKILEEGPKSPRTIRLAALHLTGLWLVNPHMIKYYMKELKLLTLYGSVAFDEDFEAELTENDDAKTEVSLLAKSGDCELTEAYVNTELYARVSVAVLFYKLADLAEMGGSEKETDDCCAALKLGKLFLLELLDSAVNDKDLAKELYKKYSAGLEFECIPMSLMERVMNFLNKKFIFSKHEMLDNNSSGSFLDQLFLRPLLDMEREDQLLEQTLQSRVVYMEKLNANRQQLVLIASLIDRIPNLAGLARTCEVLVLGREKEGIPAEIIHVLGACIEIPQLGVLRSLNVHVSGAIAVWEYT